MSLQRYLKIQAGTGVEMDITEDVGDLLISFLKKIGLEEYKKQIVTLEFTRVENEKLTKLDLDLSRTTTLPEDTFSLFTDIEMLNLSAMGLETLPVRIFNPLPKLRILGLRQNKLRAIGPEYFRYNQNLELIILEGNPLDSIFDLVGVKIIF